MIHDNRLGAKVVRPLTVREAELLALVAAGRTNAEIGQRVARSEKTVRNLLSMVYAKLGVVNRAQAAAVFVALDLKGLS